MAFAFFRKRQVRDAAAPLLRSPATLIADINTQPSPARSSPLFRTAGSGEVLFAAATEGFRRNRSSVRRKSARLMVKHALSVSCNGRHAKQLGEPRVLDRFR
jgi:hypothetical protein